MTPLLAPNNLHDISHLAMLWQTETMWMHTADNGGIVRLSHAALVTLLCAIIQSRFTDLFLLRNNIIKHQQADG